MTDAALNLNKSDKGIDLSGSQADSVEASAAGRDFNQYQGVPFPEVARLLTRWLDKEPAQQALAIAAIDGVETRLATLERLLERLTGLIAWLAGAMIAQAIFTGVALFLTLWVLLGLLGPQLVAGR